MDTLEAVLIETPEAKRLETATEITAAEDYVFAGRLLKLCKQMIVDVKAKYAAKKENAHLAHRAVCEQENGEKARYELWVKRLDAQMGGYEREQRRIQAEMQRKLDEQMRKQEEEQRLAEAVALEQSGDHATAAAVLAAPVFAVPVATIPTAIPKIEGLSQGVYYKAEVVNIGDFLRWVASDVASRAHFVEVYLPSLNQIAARGKGIGMPPGTKAVETTRRASR